MDSVFSPKGARGCRLDMNAHVYNPPQKRHQGVCGQSPSQENTLTKQHEAFGNERSFMLRCSLGGLLEKKQHLQAEQASNHYGRGHTP